ncbi:MAG: KTSC domain-containing protein [Verrucomicrobiota bacterium]|nr:KTSC domain-containing protein [Verrucomicrobiota bacterium]
MKTPPVAALFSILFLLAIPAPGQDDGIVPSRIKRVPVTSSNVSSVGYSPKLHALEIEFVRGAIYRFLDVPPRLHRDLLSSNSKGRFIAENIRGRYRFVRIRARSQADALRRDVAAGKK